MWAPEIGPRIVISTNSIAAVAIVLPSSATASLPFDRFSAMMPEPITVAKRKKEPTASAASLRARGASANSSYPQHGADAGRSCLGAQQTP
jgi:hypothetical protein